VLPKQGEQLIIVDGQHSGFVSLSISNVENENMHLQLHKDIYVRVMTQAQCITCVRIRFFVLFYLLLMSMSKTLNHTFNTKALHEHEY
jgi:hypothetical protein